MSWPIQFFFDFLLHLSKTPEYYTYHFLHIHIAMNSQVEIKYTTTDGSRYMRTITQQRDTTQDRDAMEMVSQLFLPIFKIYRVFSSLWRRWAIIVCLHPLSLNFFTFSSSLKCMVRFNKSCQELPLYSCKLSVKRNLSLLHSDIHWNPLHQNDSDLDTY